MNFSFFKKLDIFSLQIPLPYNKKKKYETFCGACLSILFLLFAGLSISYFSLNLINKTKPYVMEQHTYSTESVKMNFSEYNLLNAFSIYSENLLDEFYNESIFTVQANYFSFNRKTQKIAITQLEIGKCEINDSNPAKKLFSNKNVSHLACFKSEIFNNLIIYGSIEDHEYQSIELRFTRCQNITNASKCGTKEEIDFLLNNSWITIYSLNTKMDVSNYLSPITHTELGKSAYFSKNTMQSIQIKYGIDELITDNGLVAKNEKITKFAKITKIINENHYTNQEQFAYIVFEYTKERTVTLRIYDKIPQILGQTGGMLNLFYVLLKHLLQPIFEVIFYSEIINKHYFFKSPNQDLKGQNKKKKKVYIKNNKIKNFCKKIFGFILNFIKKIKAKKNEPKRKKVKITFNEQKKFNIGDNLKVKNIDTFGTNTIKKKKKFGKFQTNFFELLAVRYLIRKKNLSEIQKLLLTAISDISEKIEIDFVIKKLREIDIIKSLIFDEENLDIIRAVPKCLVAAERRNEKVFLFAN